MKRTYLAITSLLTFLNALANDPAVRGKLDYSDTDSGGVSWFNVIVGIILVVLLIWCGAILGEKGCIILGIICLICVIIMICILT